MAKRAFVWIDTRYWLDSYEIGSLTPKEFMEKFSEYVENNTLYEDAHDEWRRESKKLTKIVFERDDNVCRKCGSTRDLQIDHIYPVSRGGSNELSNLQILCKTCNIKKGNRI